MQRKNIFESHPLSQTETLARKEARKIVMAMGLLASKGDPRQVHHIDGNATNNALDNLAVVNACQHSLWHNAKSCPKTGNCESEVEKRFPSFCFINSRPVPFLQWLKSNT